MTYEQKEIDATRKDGSGPDRDAGLEPMKAIIIYQDLASATKANAILQNLKLPADARVEWEVVPVRAEMLRFPPTTGEALMAATDAHLMLFAGPFSDLLPFWLLDWLKRWAAVRQVKDAVVAVTAGAALPVIQTLREFAGQHGLSFIMGADVAHDPWILRSAPGFEAYRHWGINE